MATFVVAPSLELCMVTKRGSVQVESEDAIARCPRCHPSGLLRGDCEGLRLTSLPAEMHHMEYYLRQVQTKFIERQRVRGFDLFDNDLTFHGPFPSYDFVNTMVDVNSSLFRDAQKRDVNGDEHPELALPAVFERVENGFKDYVFVGQFLKRGELTEVITVD